MAKQNVCCVCKTNKPVEFLKRVEIKGKIRNICTECAASIKGLV